MRSNQDALFSWNDVRLTLQRQRWKAGGVFLAILVACLFWAVFAPRKYESTAQLYIRLGRGTATLDATANGNLSASIYQTREDEINTARQIADGRAIAEKVVDQLGPHAILYPRSAHDASSDTPPSPSLLGRLVSLLPQLDPESARSRAIRTLQHQMRIWSPSHSSIIAIRCTAATPALAQRIAQTWTDTFLSEYIRLTHSARSFEFFTKQVENTQTQLRDVERQLRDLKTEAGLVSVAGQARVLEQELANLRAHSDTNQAALGAARARAQDLSHNLENLPMQVVLQDFSGIPNHAWDLMRARLYDLQTREAELQVKYTDIYEPLVATRQQRKDLESILSSQADSRKQVMLGPNPTYQALQQELLKEQAFIAGRTAEDKALRSQQALLKAEIQTFNEQGRHIGELERKATVLQTTYLAHAAKMEEARIDEAIEQDRITSVNVTQPAGLMEKPVSPAKTRWLFLGLLLGLAGAVGTALVADRLDHRLVASLEGSVPVPALASLANDSASSPLAGSQG